MSVTNVWPPDDWCAALNPARTHMCDLPKGHDGDHSGLPLPTVELDDSTWRGAR